MVLGIIFLLLRKRLVDQRAFKPCCLGALDQRTYLYTGAKHLEIRLTVKVITTHAHYQSRAALPSGRVNILNVRFDGVRTKSHSQHENGRQRIHA